MIFLYGAPNQFEYYYSHNDRFVKSLYRAGAMGFMGSYHNSWMEVNNSIVKQINSKRELIFDLKSKFELLNNAQNNIGIDPDYYRFGMFLLLKFNLLSKINVVNNFYNLETNFTGLYGLNNLYSKSLLTDSPVRVL